MKDEIAVIDRCKTFVGFGENVLGKKFYPKQKEVLDALFKAGSNVSAVFNNDGGKTRECIATAILASLILFPKGRVITTSGSFRQIKDQLNPELHKYATRFPQLRFLDCRIEGPNKNNFWNGFSTVDAGKFEGQHAGGPDEPLLMIYDEAKTIKDPIFEAGDRCRTTRRLYASSAGYAQGEFWRSQTTRRRFFTCVKQTADECPHIPKERIAIMRAKWGADHVLVKSALDAEFMSFVEGAIVQIGALDALLANPPIFAAGERKAFCDFAWSESASGDENVMALRDGNRITIPLTFRAKGIHAVAARFIQAFQQIGLEPWEIYGDGDGEGSNIIKILAELGWPITPVYNGSKDVVCDRYYNVAAEMWCQGAMDIVNARYILPDDPELYGQMLDRKIVPSNNGLLAIESKQAMKDPNREGGPVANSPDRADAVFGAMFQSAKLQHFAPRQAPRSFNRPQNWRVEVESGQSSTERRRF